MDDHTLHWWASVMHKAEIGSLLVAAFAALCLGLSVWLSKKYSHEIHEREARAAAVLIAEAKKEGLEAGKVASVAVLRAAELEKEAAGARLETERLKAQLAWREITSAQAALLAEALRGQHFEVPLSFTANDAEASAYADQLADALVAAGIGVTLNPTAWAGPAPVGVRVSRTESPQADRLTDQFT